MIFTRLVTCFVIFTFWLCIITSTLLYTNFFFNIFKWYIINRYSITIHFLCTYYLLLFINICILFTSLNTFISIFILINIIIIYFITTINTLFSSIINLIVVTSITTCFILIINWIGIIICTLIFTISILCKLIILWTNIKTLFRIRILIIIFFLILAIINTLFWCNCIINNIRIC